jgi:hypothetical protein
MEQVEQIRQYQRIDAKLDELEAWLKIPSEKKADPGKTVFAVLPGRASKDGRPGR